MPPGDPASLAVTFVPVTGGLDGPNGIANAGDGSGRLFVVEQTGRIRIVRDGTLEDAPFLDLSDRISCCGERGLLGLAFHPDFPADPRVFVDFTDGAGNTVVASVEVAAPDADVVDRSTLRELLTVEQPFGNHNGGHVAFGPDGFLYVGLGDGGSGGDPRGNGQRLDTLLGTILRLDVDGGIEPYSIPRDNPFLDTPDARREIAHAGLRNPWRFAFDPETGDLWIGDVGQGRFEEIDVARSGTLGLNFGWNRMEATHCFPFGEGCSPAGLTLPVAEYSHDDGCSVAGGTVYRGTRQPALAGLYVFADYCSGTTWAIDPAVDGLRAPTVVGTLDGNPTAFGVDESGELFVADRGGRILRVVGGPRG
jgi:glucose/arabinose dehydrogenase